MRYSRSTFTKRRFLVPFFLLLITLVAVSDISFSQSSKPTAQKLKEIKNAYKKLGWGPAERTKLDHSKLLHDQIRKVEFAEKYYEIPIMYFDRCSNV